MVLSDFACEPEMRAGRACVVSFGVILNEPGEARVEMFARADHAMHEAKTAGPNRVVTLPIPASAA